MDDKVAAEQPCGHRPTESEQERQKASSEKYGEEQFTREPEPEHVRPRGAVRDVEGVKYPGPQRANHPIGMPRDEGHEDKRDEVHRPTGNGVGARATE
jgi:hypothetical protein